MPTDNIKPKISPELSVLLDKLTEAATDVCKLVRKIYDQAKKDGLTNKEIRELISAGLNTLSDRTIRRYLPQEAKAKTIPFKKVDNVSTSGTHSHEQRHDLIDPKSKTEIEKNQALQNDQQQRVSKIASHTDVTSIERIIGQEDMKGEATQLLALKDTVIQGLNQEIKERDSRLNQLEEQNSKFKEQSRWLIGGDRRYKAVVNQVWKELILLRNSGVIYTYIWCNGDSFTRLEPI